MEGARAYIFVYPLFRVQALQVTQCSADRAEVGVRADVKRAYAKIRDGMAGRERMKHDDNGTHLSRVLQAVQDGSDILH